jgi:ribosomal-protein-alanine N-acetyltransferase
MIKTKRISLVPLSQDYSKDLIKLWGDYDVIKYTYSTLSKTEEECKNKLVNWLELHKDNLGPNKFAILLNENLIGIAGFPVIDNDNFKCGFFYQIIRDFWGKGYGFEAADALLNYIYEKHPQASIIADAVVDNPGSVKILSKLGFSQTAIEEKGFKKNGLEIDIVHFNLER